MRERTTATAILAGNLFSKLEFGSRLGSLTKQNTGKARHCFLSGGLFLAAWTCTYGAELGEPHPYPLAFGKGRGER